MIVAESEPNTVLAASKSSTEFLKSAATLVEVINRSIPLAGASGYLVPLSKHHMSDHRLLRRIGSWRGEADSRAWAECIIRSGDPRVAFLITDSTGEAHGAIEVVATQAEGARIEEILTDDGDDTLGQALPEAIRAACNWAIETFGCEAVMTSEEVRHVENHLSAAGFRRFEGALRFCPCHTGPESGKILTAGPSISAREVSYTLDAVRSGWNSEWSGYLTRFESAFASYIGARAAIATSSCTGALHIALMALGIGPGDEVIVPEITWVATANAVVYVGATPIFADVDAVTWCMDPQSLERLITPRTKAVIPVHLYGHPADMAAIVPIARQHNLAIVEDAAPAIGAEVAGQKVGSFGDFAAFSFQGAKLLVTGEGGMLLTSNDALYEKAYAIWDQGRVPGTFWIKQTGVKYKMSNIQAALGLAQLERIDELIERKRRLHRWYAEGLEGTHGVTLSRERAGVRSAHWMASITLDEEGPISRDEMRRQLSLRNIDTRPVFPPISQYPIWPLQFAAQPVSARIGNWSINLPSGVKLSRSQVDYVCRSIREILHQQ